MENHMLMVTKIELERLFKRESFRPCVITTMDGLIVKVSRASDVLVGPAMLAVKAGESDPSDPFSRHRPNHRTRRSPGLTSLLPY
jgi:hypothetical protein